jgi:hypothetical protein
MITIAFATFASLLVGVPATWAFGLKGAIWGSNLADILSLLALLFVLRRKLASGDSPDLSKVFGSDRRGSQPIAIPEEM